MEFPMFAEAEYVEALLGPGECLYIPVTLSHFVANE